MGIFRRSRHSSQTDFDDVSLWQRLREDFSQSSELMERINAWIGNSRARLALLGVITILLVVVFFLLTTLFFGTPAGVEKDFQQVGLGQLSQMGQQVGNEPSL